MNINCFLCVRRKKCPGCLKMEFSATKKCPAKMFKIRADKILETSWGIF